MVILPDAVARGPGLKFLLVGLITLAMGVPLFFTFLVLQDRQTYAEAASTDIERGWGGPQTIGGPVLAVPYTDSRTTYTNGTGSTIDVSRSAMFLPKVLNVQVASKTEVRSRGIFDVNVYTADVVLSGTFSRPDFGELGLTPSSIAWDKALLLLPISDLHGLSENVSVLWDTAKTPVEFRPGLAVVPLAGINARVALAADGAEVPFQLTVKVRGTKSLLLAAAGGETTVTAKGNWPHPSFQGNFLPVSREITADGFNARWRVPHLARNLPQALSDPDTLAQLLHSTTFGVSFVQPVNFYLLVERALKYAMMFIGFAFLSFFLIETLSAARIHGVQYLLIGSAQVVFYLLLLSFAEQIGFDGAYFLAAAATVGLISAYARAALKSVANGVIVFGVLSVLYGLMFMLLKQEDHALVIGACAAFAAIAVTMYVTRNVEWYRAPPPKADAGLAAT